MKVIMISMLILSLLGLISGVLVVAIEDPEKDEKVLKAGYYCMLLNCMFTLIYFMLIFL